MSLRPDRSLRTESAGRVLLGGHPFRVFRLSPGGRSAVRSWFNGTGAASAPHEIDLARRLVDAGLAHPSPPPASLPCHVVIPFHGPLQELEATLTSVRTSAPASITVVDDGNEPPIPDMAGVTVIRHIDARGPGAARNTGWRGVATACASTDIVAFVDGGVTVPTASAAHGRSSGAEATWLERLAGHLVDDEVAAVAPRVVSTEGTTLIERYEQVFSPLDLGGSPSLVGPGRLVTYVPTACLLVRLSDLIAVEGFDERLRYGEDVDLVWRLAENRQVRYDPQVTVHHAPRRSLRAFAEQRFRYATAAAALDQRHPSASTPWRSSLIGVAGVALASAGRPVAAGLVGLAPITLLADRLQNTATPLATSARLLLAGHRWALRSFGESMGRTWWSLAFVATAVPALRRAAIGWMLTGWSRRITQTRSPQLILLGIVDDVAYGAGAISGAMRARSLRSLLPEISRWG